MTHAYGALCSYGIARVPLRVFAVGVEQQQQAVERSPHSSMQPRLAAAGLSAGAMGGGDQRWVPLLW